MPQRFQFDRDILHSVAGGRSVIDIPRLNIKSVEAAKSFISSYGFNPDSTEDVEKLWYFHRRALVLMVEKLGFRESEIPERLRQRKSLGDIANLLLLASSRDPLEQDLQRWACALLRCMHVFVHAENDLFSSFAEEIQYQILTPIQQCIVHDGNTHRTFLKENDSTRSSVELVAFEFKPFKTSSSTVIKLLARPEALAMKIFDKLGVRFVTKSVFDSFQVIRFLTEANLISFPHIMPDQSSNNVYPVDLFSEICEQLQNDKKDLTDEKLEKLFTERLSEKSEQDKLFRKSNEQSNENFKFIKFITRKLIRIHPEDREPFNFFYPYEVQIMDQATHHQAQSGPTQHIAYKERQIGTARQRLFPDIKGV